MEMVLDGYWVELAWSWRIFFGQHQGFRLYTDGWPTCSLRAVVLKTCGTRQSILHCLPNWAVLCGQRSCCFHETCQFWSAPAEIFWAESSDSTLPWVEWCLLIHVIMCWTQLVHLRLFTRQVMAVLTSATWWPTTAHMSVLWQSSLVLKLCCYNVSKHSTFKRLFV